MPAPKPRPARLGVTPLEDRLTPAYAGGLSVAAGDLNGDGYTDVVTVPTAGPAHVRAVSGKDGTDLFSFFASDPTFTGGGNVAVGDVDGVGRLDIVVGAGPGGGPQVQVFNGRTGERTHNFFAFDPAVRNGVHVAAGDLYHTGRADIITGAGEGGGPRVQVYDARTGASEDNFFAYDPAFRGGVKVAAGNVTGDGTARLIVAAGAGGGPQVKVFDTPGGTVVLNFFAYDPSFRGGANVAAGDTEGKGRDDIITGMGAGGGGRVRTWDGLSAALDSDFFPLDWQGHGGANVAAGDFGGTGQSSVLASGQDLYMPLSGDPNNSFAPTAALDQKLGAAVTAVRKNLADVLRQYDPDFKLSPYADTPGNRTGFSAPPQSDFVAMPLKVKAEQIFEGRNAVHTGLTIRADGQPHSVMLYQADAQGRLLRQIGPMTVGTDPAIAYDVLGTAQPYRAQFSFDYLPAGTWYYAAVIDGQTDRPSVGRVVIKSRTDPAPSASSTTLNQNTNTGDAGPQYQVWSR